MSSLLLDPVDFSAQVDQLTGFLMVFLIVFSILAIIQIIALWKLFVKAGKPGWACIVPIYNIIIMLEIARKPSWWFFLLLIPFVNIYFAIVMLNSIVKNFGKDSSFTVGVILLPYIFIPILGFGSARYLIDPGAPEQAKPLAAPWDKQ